MMLLLLEIVVNYIIQVVFMVINFFGINMILIVLIEMDYFICMWNQVVLVMEVYQVEIVVNMFFEKFELMVLIFDFGVSQSMMNLIFGMFFFGSLILVGQLLLVVIQIFG